MKPIEDILTDMAHEYEETIHTPIETIGNVSTFRGKVVGVDLSGADVWNIKRHIESAHICALNEATDYWRWLDTARYSVRECSETILSKMRKRIKYRKR